jgi:hypothetical protein
MKRSGFILLVLVLLLSSMPSAARRRHRARRYRNPALAGAQAAPLKAKIVVSKYRTTLLNEAGGKVGRYVPGTRETEIEEMGSAVPLRPGIGSPTSSGKKAKSNPEVVLSFEGLNHRDSRLAYGGNQFSIEPPSQGLCVGNGFILESVNDALRVFDANTGAPVSKVLALNEFYGFPPAIIRTTPPVFGSLPFNPSCHFDPDSGRWFHLVVDLELDPVTGDRTGRNYLDLAVSVSGDPTGAWNVYRIPGMNDGREGTPNHGCAGGPCEADSPHIGVDKNGVYITTNESPLFVDGFIGAQVYAISKAALVSGAASIDTHLFNTAQPQWQAKPGEPGSLLCPALASERQFDGARGGTNYFVSSNAVFNDITGSSQEIVVWALSNTKSLDSGAAGLQLTRTIVPSLRYAVPPPSAQKAGTIPFGEVMFGATAPGPIDCSDSHVLDARYANGKLWAVLGTAADVEGVQRAGVAWFILSAAVSNAGVSATMRNQGILALEDESLAYPTIGVTSSGRGVMGFTRVGENLHPSAGYVSIDDVAGVGEVKMAAEGQSPQDGITEYGGRPRWGDYGAAAVDGSTVYLASQYIQQPPCTAAQFIATGFTCWNTRTLAANWSTRVTKLKP